MYPLPGNIRNCSSASRRGSQTALYRDRSLLRPCRKNFGFVRSMDEETKKECADYNRNLFLEAAELAKTADLVVFDEIMAAVNYGMVPEKDILDFLENRPKKGEPDGLEIVLTGRNPSESLLGAADYVSALSAVSQRRSINSAFRKPLIFLIPWLFASSFN